MNPDFRTFAAIALMGLCGTLTAIPSALAQSTPPAESHMPGEVLVRLRTAADLPAVLARHALVNLGQFGARPIFRLGLVGSSDVEGKVAALSADPLVLVAEPNVIHETPESRKNVVWAIGGSEQGRATQWATTAIDLYDAHAVTKGKGVRVAVLDTGVDRAHPALKTRLLPGYDFVDSDGDPSERGGAADAGWGHGTHVAGIVALVAPQARIMPLRVLEPSGRGNLWVLGEALLHAIDPDGNPYSDDGAHVINLSLGTTRETRLMDKLLELATCGDDDDDDDDDDSGSGYESDEIRCNLRGGAVIVAAAGNGASRTERQYPAAEGVEGLIAIAATTPSNHLASFSNQGSWIELAAPGERIVSSVPGGGWGVWSGTSMAAPMAAGVAALLRAANPSWKAVDVTKRIADRSASLCGTLLRQVDASGALRDYVPPDASCPSLETTIDSAPAAITTSISATFTFSANAPGSTFECSLGTAAFAECTSPWQYNGLAAGAQVFRVRAIDPAGNVDATPASHSWTVEGTSSCGVATTLTATADAWVDQNSATTNKGADAILKVNSKGPNDNFRTLVRFALPVSAPAGCVVVSATLRLYAASAKTGRTLQALRIAGNWTENGVTWANQPATTGTAATTSSGYGYREWNVVSHVQAMYAAGTAHGFLIRDATENQDAEQSFHGREKGENLPQLVIHFGSAGD